MYGKLYVEFFDENGLYDRLVYEVVIVGTQSMKFGLVSEHLIKLPKKFIRGEFVSDAHVYVLNAFRRELMNFSKMDVDIHFVPTITVK